MSNINVQGGHLGFEIFKKVQNTDIICLKWSVAVVAALNVHSMPKCITL